MNTWKGLAHVALFTDDLEKTIAFYENLGGKCTMRGEAAKAAVGQSAGND